uniref:Uncharacterized protein n=1 Tax=Lactuca sativa TaxID=4236 RepID=A0A9R1UPK9_LACSA|nr:hypothetical protein LSAT_V11C800448390 [Lactuca sativa]
MFLQMIFNEKYPQIERTYDTLDMKALAPNTFGPMKQSRKAVKFAYQGLKELVKFGAFVEVEDTPTVSSINAEVVDEHMVPKPKFQFSFEEIDVSDDEEDQEYEENELTENEFEDFIQQSISNPEEDAAVTPPVVSERECDTMLTETKPPQTVHVDTETPSESDLEDLAHALLPRKRKRIDPRPVVFITVPIQKNCTPIEPGSMDQNCNSPKSQTWSRVRDWTRRVQIWTRRVDAVQQKP